MRFFPVSGVCDGGSLQDEPPGNARNSGDPYTTRDISRSMKNIAAQYVWAASTFTSPQCKTHANGFLRKTYCKICIGVTSPYTSV
uniref:Uncharacterized protein n=1 Tax=Candidatus Methanogaster sp. ANME-2c ERB4 TaxID=2759911 RepID=A0A7G9YQZ5_9EURY|nr:hypothetical protein FEGPBIBN_00002 [Methanosarcinales archaeon ANME-2c ERB4]QNO43510.1 hypothetical protein HLNDCAMK_00001 [Methanosarcinales archaeon ANME-2c ERB4]QNO44104.1 hypothetical protein NOLOAFPA_00003 [Methanosarcinales archaeon ANME-2c ERB4]QNO50429.1 hypothetical protein BPCBKEJI_00007 [Methanosarcinales archaeon ANME-2c ERB4]